MNLTLQELKELAVLKGHTIGSLTKAMFDVYGHQDFDAMDELTFIRQYLSVKRGSMGLNLNEQGLAKSVLRAHEARRVPRVRRRVVRLKAG